MKTRKTRVSFDFTDTPEVIEFLRLESLITKKSQKALIIEALKSYFGHRMELESLYKLAEKTFADWDNKVDSIYDEME